MSGSDPKKNFGSVRDKLLALSLESTRKSYYPQLQAQLETVRENERRLRLLTDHLPARIFYVDAKERYSFVNREYERSLGLARGQIIGRCLREVLGPAHYTCIAEHVRKALSGDQARFEVSATGGHGRAEWLEVHYVPDIDEQGSVAGFYAMIYDITDLRKLEANLRQAQKMEAVGTLAGGIAHDFNNLMMGIQGRVSLMKARMGPFDLNADHLDGIEAYIKSATELTRQLLGFARGGKYQVQPTNMNDILEQSSEMFGRTRKEIRISRVLEPDLWTVEVDRGQMGQVLLNLYLNAWQAMPGGGELRIRTENAEIDSKSGRSDDLAPGRYVKIEVMDTGMGMDEATKARIFDPFFTTKGMGRGTGLGLASSYGIIKNHNGAVFVDSRPGHGSTFRIYLPASDKQVAPEEKKSFELVKGHQTVLMVDDEPMILEVGGKMLEELGYCVLKAQSGQEAVQVLGHKRERIDLIVLDMIMPDMSGGETFDKIRQIDPDARVLLSSGYSIDGEATNILDRGCRGFIQKPFTMSELSSKIRDILR